jgi:hypothetical protein
VWASFGGANTWVRMGGDQGRDAPWAPRAGSQAVFFMEAIWFLGGVGLGPDGMGLATGFNDVWWALVSVTPSAAGLTRRCRCVCGRAWCAGP